MSMSREGRMLPVLCVCLILVGSIAAALTWGTRTASGDEAISPESQGPNAAQTKELLESGAVEPFPVEAETDLQAAQTMPHRELDRDEALELVEAVFEPELESAAGIYGELEPERFLSDNAAVVPASSLPEPPGSEGESPAAENPDQPVLVESMLPLRTEGESGKEEAVDLELEPSDGELQPSNPLTEVGIPQQLGKEVSLSAAEVTIAVAGAPQELPATNVEGEFAFYPEIAEDTDLVVTPTPEGVETMTDVRSAEAPTQTTYDLSIPAGAELRPTKEGGAEVAEGERATVLIPPPSAIDAAGNPVQTGLEVTGGSITVAIKPTPSTVFPVLVDPEYKEEGWRWTLNHDSLAAWAPSTTNSSAMNAVPYERWAPQYPGLDITSGYGGNAASGTNANWAYWVPRYWSDENRYHAPPSSWVGYLWAEGVLFLPYGSTANYPALVVGLVDPGPKWSTAPNATRVHYGGEGEMNSWSNAYWLPNGPEGYSWDKNAKGVDMNLVTYENEYPAKLRDTYMADAFIGVFDEDAPKITSVTPPMGWTTGASATLGYEFGDAGLGIRSAGVRQPGETAWQVGGGADFACSGTTVSPCPRSMISTETGAAKLLFVPKAMPTGIDNLEVVLGDPFWDAGHTATKIVQVKVDNTPPELTLSGALTEQETVGTTLPEYPLEISARDGGDDAPQSGVAKVEVKVDGKKVTMPEEAKWNPGCATQNCAFSRNWTLKASEFALGNHEVEVIATDAAGVPSSQVLEIELGQEPLQTSFTSPHPTFEDHEISSVSFKATREGKPVEGATFKCSLDGTGETPTTPCGSPYAMTEHLEPGKWHTLLVASVDKSGNADPTPAKWKFKTGTYPAAPPSEKLVYPETGKRTASYFTLEAEWGANPEGKAGEGVTGVTFEMKLPKLKYSEPETVFEPVPTECTTDGQGHQVSWPLRARSHPGHNAPVYLRVRNCPAFKAAGYPEKEIQFRAVFDGGEKVAGASEPTAAEFVYMHDATSVASDATEMVGPASVDLLTGAFTMSRTDVSIPVPGYEANLEFTRVYRSTEDTQLPGYSKVMGGSWQPSSPLESEFEGEAWTRIEKKVIPEKPAVMGKECWDEEGEEVECGAGCNPEYCEEWIEEPAQPREEWIVLFANDGSSVPFEVLNGAYIAPEYAKELKLTLEGTSFVLGYPNGTRTTFEKDGEHEDWLPKTISYQANANSMRMVYEPEGKSLRLIREISPTSFGCPEKSETTPGCRSLVFNYTTYEINGREKQTRLTSISYYGPSGAGNAETVAQYLYGLVGTSPNQSLVLSGEMDPRVPNSAAWEGYEYVGGHSNLLSEVKPAGLTGWKFAYEFPFVEVGPTKLKSVSRAGATTTIAYGVPVSGTGAPYAMGPESIATWGQTDTPVDATAVFPPTHVPSEYPPHEYTGATVHYMDPEGHQVNVASPSPPGISGASISTTETDVHGDVVRELDPQNRLYALEASNPVARSHELDSHSVYNAAGTEQLESWGPLHRVRLQSGEGVDARQHTVTHYDEGAPPPPAGTPPAYLPTKETVSVVVPGKEGELEPRTTQTGYDWTLRKPTETIVDPAGLHIRSVTKYNTAGQVVETRQPKNEFGGGAGTTQTIYYSVNGTNGECISTQWANLPCKVLPVAQASGANRPKLLVKQFTAYNNLDESTEVKESAGGEGQERITTTTYGPAGRPESVKIKGGASSEAAELPATKTEYSTTTGLPVKQSFVCAPENCSGFDSQAATTTYNALGQVAIYEDADGNKAETTYDAYGRPVTNTDGRGSQTVTYDPVSGLPTSLEVSGVGTFTARYDADGDLVETTLPNGLSTKKTYNAVGEPMSLTYSKTSSCGESCTWFEETLERGADGRILSDTNTLASGRYSYDKAGRLEESFETPTRGSCTTRHYSYDADSNRLSKTTSPPGVGGACSSSGGTTQYYEYDEADRLMGAGIKYDAWGRITSLAGGYAGGTTLETKYFASNMVATQIQNGVTNSFQLDATGRQRQREQTGGVAGTEIFHYDNSSDSPAWTSLGTAWTRNVVAFGGELAAVQESSGSTTFKLTNLHGDVVASASPATTATSLIATYRSSEFGEPLAGVAGRFGWVGARQRRSEFASGVIQMGARSYIPQLGRFLTPDPIPGGSANAYDYANQDPIDGFDLDGLKPKKKQKAAHARPNHAPHVAAQRKKCCGLIHVSIPNPFKAIGNLLGGYAEKAEAVAWHTIVREVEKAAEALEFESKTIEDAERVMEEWERRTNPFAVHSFKARSSCLQNGAQAFFEAYATEGADAARLSSWFANGCVEGAAESE